MANRTLISLGDERTAKLDQIAHRRGQSRSALVREAVDRLIADQAGDQAERRRIALEAGFGLWARHGVSIDPHQYERHRRAEWTRPWDDDYEEVRAESPECFTEDDDRERAHYLALTAKAAGARKKQAP